MFMVISYYESQNCYGISVHVSLYNYICFGVHENIYKIGYEILLLTCIPKRPAVMAGLFVCKNVMFTRYWLAFS